MKATFDKQKLLAAITPAAGISQTKNTLTSVDGLLFECPPNPKYGDYDTDNPNLCRISAFDLEKGLRTTVECNVYEKGMFVINTVKILQIVRAPGRRGNPRYRRKRTCQYLLRNVPFRNHRYSRRGLPYHAHVHRRTRL